MGKKEKLRKLQEDLAKLLTGKKSKDPERTIAKEAADVVSLPSGIVKKIGSIAEMERKLLKLLDKTKKSGGPKKVKDLEPLYKDKIKTPTPKLSDAIKDIKNSVEKISKKKMSPEEKIISRQAVSRESFKDKITSIEKAKEYGKTCNLKQYQALKREAGMIADRKKLYNKITQKEHYEALQKREKLYDLAMRIYQK